MALIRMHQGHTISTLHKNVEDAMSIVGEQVLVLQMYSALSPGKRRCSLCFDDVYGNSSTSLQTGVVCSKCFGTTYDNGIDKIHFTKAIIGRGKFNDSMEGSKGQAEMASHHCSTMLPVKLHRNDYVVRVKEWLRKDDIVRPTDFDVYKIVSSPVFTTIKDGFDRTGDSLIGSAFDIVLQSEDNPLNKIRFPGIDSRIIAIAQPFVYIPDYS